MDANHYTDQHSSGPLTAVERERAALADVAQALRAASWDIAVACVETALERDLLPSLRPLGLVRRLSNLPSFIGALASSLTRPRPTRDLGTNPILARLARDHVVEREQAGFTAREVVQEFLLLRRVIWQTIQQRADRFDGRTVLQLEDRLNSILDEVIAECTVIYHERATQTLSEQSRTDGLTGLLNHQAFHTRLDRELDRARRYGSNLHVIYFDLDEFKSVNDTHGHASGDQVLRLVSTAIRESIRESDFAGRLGGDEFVVALVESSELAAHLLLDRLRLRVAEHSQSGAIPAEVGISAGCAGFPEEADNAQELLVLADRRQYVDKRARKLAAAQVSEQVAATRAAAVEASAMVGEALEAADAIDAAPATGDGDADAEPVLEDA
jgi:diguanylate cyclase (GGDEF)-like protein